MWKLTILGTLVVAVLGLPGELAAQQAVGEVRSDLHELERGRVVAMAATTMTLDGGRLSGVFVASVDGRIRYQATDASTRGALELDQLQDTYRFRAPLGMVFAEPNLYVFDGASRRIWSLEMAGGQVRRRPRSFDLEFEQPRQMAVSPDGVVAVIDGRRLFLLEEGREPVEYTRSSFLEPVGLSFSASDTLHVLDRARGSLTTIKFVRLRSGQIRFRSETPSLAGVSMADDWHAMTVYGGVVYLASHDRVYAYIESTEELIPVLRQEIRFDTIFDIALNDDVLLVLTEGGELSMLERPEPVALILEGTADTSQRALLDFYKYLQELGRLPTREILAYKSFERIEDFLFQEGMLLAPIRGAESQVRVYVPRQKTVYGEGFAELDQKLAAKRAAPSGQEEQAKADLAGKEKKWWQIFSVGKADTPALAQSEMPWARVVCSLNPGFCDGGVPEGIRQDTALVVPDVSIETTLGRKRVYLDGRPIRSYIQELVFTPRLLETAVTPDFLRRLNPTMAKLTDEQILDVKTGVRVLPSERWSVTAAVPATEYEAGDSGLWRFERLFEAVSIRSRRGIPDLGMSSLAQTPQSGADDPADGCAVLHAKREELLRSIGYPSDPGAAEVVEQAVRLGVLERDTTVVRTHQVFGLEKDAPTWHSFNVASELVPDPQPASFEAGKQLVEAHDEYSIDAHHGTHVSALIAGRRGECWSGLLPHGRLVLVDLTDGAAVSRNVIDAIAENVFVFNVSQSREEPWEDLWRTIKDDGRALWVVAAGNGGEDMNKDLERTQKVPSPALWGAEPNVIAVTASDMEGRILPAANRGKLFVDLVAPGHDVYSASEQHMYGPASGTSQATPQVAAVAALLVDEIGARLVPGDAKARLIATSEWKPEYEYEGKVWGGFLDFQAAARFPSRDLVVTTTGEELGQLHSMRLDNPDVKIAVTNVTHYYEREGEGDRVPKTLKFSNILSLQKLDSGDYRVVLKEQQTNRLKIILDAKLKGASGLVGGENKLKCSRFELFDPETGEFEDADDCDSDLSITEIERYVRGGPYRIQWQ